MLKLLVLVILVAVLVYATVRVIERRGIAQPPPRRTPPRGRPQSRGQSPGQSPGQSRPQQRGPIGPDDDEEFLRDLDRKRRPPEPDTPEQS